MNILVMIILAVNPYISRVYEYLPAPGQFTNALPSASAEDTPESMAAKVEERLANHAQQMISLGGFGGYVVFGFDHEVRNEPNSYDLKIEGNAFYASAADAEQLYGSSEPGIVMVSRDENGNGLPDDRWYELAGSEENNEQTVVDYQITYFRPTAQATAEQYIRWTDNLAQTGYIPKNMFHSQDYFPLWVESDSLVFSGTKLRANAVNTGTDSSPYYVQYCFDWGYVDNQPNTVASVPERHASEFDIDWAVDENRQAVHLEGIQFVKVYTALNQLAGSLGETSTEIVDAYDLHALVSELQEIQANQEIRKTWRNGQIVIERDGKAYTLLGNQIL